MLCGKGRLQEIRKECLTFIKHRVPNTKYFTQLLLYLIITSMMNGEDDNPFLHPIFQMEKLRFREIKTFAKDHVARKQSRNFRSMSH